MKRTLDELMIVNPGSPSRRHVRLRATPSAESRSGTGTGCPEATAPLYLGCDGIVYRAVRMRRPAACWRVLVAAPVVR
jgi:hypothetical protein